MRLVFLYYSETAGNLKFDPSIPSTNKYLVHMPDEGLFYLFQKLIDARIIDECLIVVETTQGIGSYQYLNPRIQGYAVPTIESVMPYIKEDDIVFTRGGFKRWFPFLMNLHSQNRWSWLYAANTGRQRWPFWDIVFDDLNGKHYKDSNDRLYFNYRKPTNEDVFFPVPTNQIYDIMIGASHVHDKKGQFRVVDALIHLKSKGFNFKCVLPGSFKNGTWTGNIIRKIQTNNLSIEIPGMVSRRKLARFMNRSRIFVHGGAAGQNDRGPIEAMACGCNLVISAPSYHAPCVWSNPQVTTVVESPLTTENLARGIERAWEYLNRKPNGHREKVVNHFQESSSINLIVEDFRKLLSFFERYPRVDRKALISEYGL